MPIYLVRHVTTYRYKSPVAFGEHRMMFRPRDGFDQRTISAELSVEPEPVECRWTEDSAGNLVGSARFGRRGRILRFESRVEVDVTPFDATALRIAPHAVNCPFSYGAEEARDLARFTERQHLDPDHAVDRFARRILDGDGAQDTFGFLCRLSHAIRRDFAYLRREEAGIQDPAETLRLGSGTCRDFAVLMCEAVRVLGFAARFASGYLHVRSGDASAELAGGNTHAWLQVYLPGAGWIDFDPTSGTVGNAGLIRVAAVRDPRQAAPLTGSFTGFPSDFLSMEVLATVAPVTAPRHDVTRSGRVLPPGTYGPARDWERAKEGAL